MSGNPWPKGREVNLKTSLAGTQAIKIINITVGVGFAVSAGIFYFAYSNGIPGRFLDGIRRKEREKEDDLTFTRKRITQIREARRRIDDPYYRYGEERIRQGLSVPQPPSATQNDNTPTVTKKSAAEGNKPVTETKSPATEAKKPAESRKSLSNKEQAPQTPSSK